MRLGTKFIGFMMIASIGALIGWASWFPVREWMFAQIPAASQYAGLIKIAIVVLIAWGGGIAIPFALLAFALSVLAAD